MHSCDEVKQFICELLDLYPNKKTDVYHIGKAYYYANFYALKEYGTVVSAHYCVKMDFGPGIDGYREILQEMEIEGIIVREPEHQVRLAKACDYVEFSGCIHDAIKKAYEEVKGKSFQELKDATHNLQSYQNAGMGQSIDISDDFLTEQEIERARQFRAKVSFK